MASKRKRSRGNMTGKDEKKRAFRKVKRVSDRFIHLSSDQCLDNAQYIEWCQKADKDALRRG